MGSLFSFPRLRFSSSADAPDDDWDVGGKENGFGYLFGFFNLAESLFTFLTDDVCDWVYKAGGR